ncbi:MAG: hypothetical protein [Olavius algarvensis Gamma 1 endosymbiont]|nr:MAG: hypothetical protein [Olavius algarvensis Gamma 1 endosymbiont]
MRARIDFFIDEPIVIGYQPCRLWPWNDLNHKDALVSGSSITEGNLYGLILILQDFLLHHLDQPDILLEHLIDESGNLYAF